MAIYTLLPDVNRPIGSVGGSVFTKSGSSFVIRHRLVPVNKRTTKQTQRRIAFASFQSKWKSLTAGERQDFLDHLAEYPRFNSAGNPVSILPINLFCSSNLNQETQAGGFQSTISSPTIFPAVSVGFIRINLEAQSAIFSTTPVMVPSGFSYYLFTSPSQPTGVTDLPLASMRLTHVFDPLSTTELNLWESFINTHGTPEPFVGFKVFALFLVVEDVTGQVGDSFFGSNFDLVTQSGIYAPVYSNLTNIAVIGAFPSQFMRVGNIVTVSGRVNITPIAIAIFLADFTLPIPSIFTAGTEVAGSGNATNPDLSNLVALANPVTNQGQFACIPPTLNTNSYHFVFQYEIL